MSTLIKERLNRMIKEAADEMVSSGRLKIEKLPALMVDVPKNREHGDLYTSAPFSLAKASGKSPQEISRAMLDILEGTCGDPGFIKKIEPAGNGFLNFFISSEYLRANMIRIIEEAGDYGRSDQGKGKKVQIEFASVGPTGPIHIGHARGAVVGDVLTNILERTGCKVEREYYINDVGTQIDILGKSLKARYRELYGLDSEFPPNGYEGSYLVDMAVRLKEEFGKDAADRDIKFFSGLAVRETMKVIKRDLAEFGVKFDSWVSEEGLHLDGTVADVVEKLKDSGCTLSRDGALWFKAPEGDEEIDKENVIIRSSGTPTYFASDIAYHRKKYERDLDLLIDIWGQDHHGHVKRLKDAVSALGYDKDKLKIILYQLVSLSRNGQPLRMSTRKGEFITLREVMDEVGADSIRFFFLMRKASSHLDFDLELAKQQSVENPVYYVQYAHARICSIFREADKKKVEFDVSGIGLEDLELLQDDTELEIMKKLAFFPDCVAEMALMCEPHGLTMYSRELAALFHKFYTDHRIIGDDGRLARARLALISAIKIVLSNSLVLMGIKPKDRM